MTTTTTTEKQTTTKKKASTHNISVWNVEDIQQVRPDLNDEQAWEVLQQAERRHDAEHGINWDILRIHADDLYPEPEETATAEEGAS